MSIARLRSALDDLEAERVDVDRFCMEWRRALLDMAGTLPADLTETAEALLMRMESARWFSGEACGFSGKDLTLALRRWLAAADSGATTPGMQN